MKTLVLSLTLLFSTIAAFGQYLPETTQDTFPKNIIKLHKNFRYESLPDLVFDGEEFNFFVERQDIFAPGFGLTFTKETKKGNLLEIGIAEVMFAKNRKAETFIEIDTLLYQDRNEITYNRFDFIGHLAYGTCLGESDNGKLRMNAVLAAMPFFQSFDIETSEQVLATNTNILGVSLAAIPSFQFRVMKKGFIELSLPIRVLRLASVSQKEGNPFLNLRERQQTTSDFDFLPSVYELRLTFGIGF